MNTQKTDMPLPLDGAVELLAAKAPAQQNNLPPDAMADLAAGRAKLILLTRGRSAVVDADDYAVLAVFTWFFEKGYAVRTVWRRLGSPVNGKRQRHSRKVFMHRIIAGTPNGLQTDHINGDKLNDRRVNLRWATAAENQWNAGRRKDNSTGFKGVVVHKRDSNFQAIIRVNGRRIHIGYFPDPESASIAYQQAASQIHGEFWRQKA